MLGISLSSILELEAASSASASGANAKGKGGFGSAKSVILLYLQGGPSHIDIWDPKPDAPENVRGIFKPIKTNVPGIWLSEVMPKLAQQMDKATLIRSVSYTPNGLFNHTAAMYQMPTANRRTRFRLPVNWSRLIPTITRTWAPTSPNLYRPMCRCFRS